MRILGLIVIALIGFGISRVILADRKDAGTNVETMQPRSTNTLENQNKALDGVANVLAGKGANVIDKRVFESLTACDASMGKVASEYQRRGISPNNVVDGTAFLGAPGKATVMVHGDMAYYIACLDFAQYGWAGYIHYSLTKDKLEAFSK